MVICRKTLRELSRKAVREIDAFVETNFSTVFHEIPFNQIIAEVFHTELSYNLVYNNAGKLVALCPLHTLPKRVRKETYSNPAMYDVPYGGWIYDRKELSLYDLMNHLQLCFNESLTYWSIPQIEHNDYDAIGGIHQYTTGVIDLTSTLDDILHQCLKRKRRQSINSAIRKGVIVEKLNSRNLNIFTAQCANLKRAVGLAEAQNIFFERIYGHYSNENKVAAFASKIGNIYIGSGLIVGNRHMIHLWVAGKARDTHTNVPRQELIVWESIKWAKERGSRYFDLCVIEPERLPHIARFKFEFCKKLVPFYRVNKRRIGYSLLSKMQAIF
jgi:hypothetical protein